MALISEDNLKMKIENIPYIFMIKDILKNDGFILNILFFVVFIISLEV